MEDLAFKGRYLKVVDDKCIQHYGVRNGDYLKYSHTDDINHEHWGDVSAKKYYYGYKAHTNKYFELMPVGFVPPGKLSVFPSEGVCWKPTIELRDFLIARENSSTTACGYHVKGIAWNYNSCWEVASYSAKPEYKIKDLEPFLQAHMVRQTPAKIPDHLKERPLTPDESFSFTAYVPFSVRNGYRLPDKWCIHNNPLNHEMIDAFMYKHRSEWASHTNAWTTEGSHGYFHYPPVNQVCHSEDKPEEGYTLITTQQFKNYVLTVNNNLINNEDDRSRSQQRGPSEQPSGVAIKVQRPDITVRGREPARGVGIECSNIQIEVGSGHLPDKFGLS